MALGDRSSKARASALFGKVLARDKQGRATKVIVPGSEGRQYEVILRRNGHVSGECNLNLGNLGYKPCEGNQHTVCYHVLAAMVLAASVGGQRVNFCESEDHAQTLSRLGMSVYRVTNWPSPQRVSHTATLWITVKGPHNPIYTLNESTDSTTPNEAALPKSTAPDAIAPDAIILKQPGEVIDLVQAVAVAKAAQRARDLNALYGEEQS